MYPFLSHHRGQHLPPTDTDGPSHSQVQERASNRLYYLSAKIVQVVRGSLLCLTEPGGAQTAAHDGEEGGRFSKSDI